MSTLHLTNVDANRRALVMRAVRRAIIAAGYEGDALAEAERAVYAVLNGQGPYGLVEGPPELVQTAADAFVDTLGNISGAGNVVIDMPEPDEPSEAPEADIEREFDPANMPAEFEPSREARRTAIWLMAVSDGSAQQAWFHAKLLARNTGQVEFWVEVGRVLGDAFTFRDV